MRKLLVALCLLVVVACAFGQAKIINGMLFVGDPYMAKGGMRGISLNNNPQDVTADYYLRSKKDTEYYGYTTMGGKDILFYQAVVMSFTETGNEWITNIHQIAFGIEIPVLYKSYFADDSVIYKIHRNDAEEPVFKTSGEWEFEVSDEEKNYYKATPATYSLKGKYPIDCIMVEQTKKVIIDGKKDVIITNTYWLYGFGIIATAMPHSGEIISELHVVEL